MIKIAVCDDDKAFVGTMADMINNIMLSISDNVEYQLHTFVSPQELIDHIGKNQINILFLDIDMPDMSGFEVARTIQNCSSETITVFVSAYDSFVYDSFQSSPLGFLRKSHIKDELKPTISRALNKFFENGEVINLKTVDGDVITRLKDICLIESIGNYYTAHLLSGHSYKCRGTLASVNELLLKKDFFRIHKAFIVNLQNVSVVNVNRRIVLSNGKEFVVSTSKWQGFKDAYMDYTRKRGTFI